MLGRPDGCDDFAHQRAANKAKCLPCCPGTKNSPSSKKTAASMYGQGYGPPETNNKIYIYPYQMARTLCHVPPPADHPASWVQRIVHEPRACSVLRSILGDCCGQSFHEFVLVMGSGTLCLSLSLSPSLPGQGPLSISRELPVSRR
jgi:hypothetical protein